jgi:hypothetical protein
MPRIAPRLPVHYLFRQAFRFFPMGFLASTTFIGAAGNNFSHKIKNRISAICRRLNQTVRLPSTHCLKAVQRL